MEKIVNWDYEEIRQTSFLKSYKCAIWNIENYLWMKIASLNNAAEKQCQTEWRTSRIMATVVSVTEWGCVSMPHLVAIHFVAKFLSKRFDQGHVDDIADYGHSKCITSNLWVNIIVWCKRGRESGAGEKDVWLRF